MVSTGTAGYVNLQGNYQLPAVRLPEARVELLLVRRARLQDAGLAKLGIDPQHWLTNPSVVGTETVNGASTTHIRAGVDVAALIGDLNTFLAKAAKSPAPPRPDPDTGGDQAEIAAEVKHPTVDIWTGKSDTTLRKLALNLNVPGHRPGVDRARRHDLGGDRADPPVRTPQPAADDRRAHRLHPYSEFTAKLQTIGQALAGALGSAAGSGRRAAPARRHGLRRDRGAGAGSSAGLSKYSDLHPEGQRRRHQDAEVRVAAQQQRRLDDD